MFAPAELTEDSKRTEEDERLDLSLDENQEIAETAVLDFAKPQGSSVERRDLPDSCHAGSLRVDKPEDVLGEGLENFNDVVVMSG